MTLDHSSSPLPIPYVALSTISPPRLSMDPDRRRDDHNDSPNKRRRLASSQFDYIDFAPTYGNPQDLFNSLPSTRPGGDTTYYHSSRSQYHSANTANSPGMRSDPFASQRPLPYFNNESVRHPMLEDTFLASRQENMPPFAGGSQPTHAQMMAFAHRPGTAPMHYHQPWAGGVPHHPLTMSTPSPYTANLSQQIPRAPTHQIRDRSMHQPPLAPLPGPQSMLDPTSPAARLKFPKDAIVLTLSQATEQSIADIPEHKRECPACQLEFEVGNFVSSVSCCDTYMHVVCFSAWTNSTTGPLNTRPKICMKCRKPIDAKRKLNKYVRPVQGNEWDQGQDFGVPPRLIGSTPMQFDISVPVAYPARQSIIPGGYNNPVPEREIPPHMQQEYNTTRGTQLREMQRAIERSTAAYRAWRMSTERHARVSNALSQARESRVNGGPITQREVDGLVQRLADADNELEVLKEQRDSSDDNYRELRETHLRQQLDFLRRMRRYQAEPAPIPVVESGERSTLRAHQN